MFSTTVGGDSATGTFELETMSDYTSLRQSITISGTEIATSSSDSSVETVALIVFAGGVAWILAGDISILCICQAKS